jgi:hypothetical protein
MVKILHIMHHNEWDYGWWLQLDRICFFRTRLWLNVILHTPHSYKPFPVCRRWCTFKLLLTLNVLLHTPQQYRRSPVCTHWCAFRSDRCGNVLLHTSQQLPECTRWCNFKPCVWPKFFYTDHTDIDDPQYVHVDVISDNQHPWKFYYTHHMELDRPNVYTLMYLHASFFIECFITLIAGI